MDIDITEKQEQFINSTAFETLFRRSSRRRKKLWTTNRRIIVCTSIPEVKANYIP